MASGLRVVSGSLRDRACQAFRWDIPCPWRLRRSCSAWHIRLRHGSFSGGSGASISSSLPSPLCRVNPETGGNLIVTMPYHGYLKNMALSLVNGWDKHFSPLWDMGHIKFWSRRTLCQLLEQNGFEVTGFYGVGRAPLFWKSMIVTARSV